MQKSTTSIDLPLSKIAFSEKLPSTEAKSPSVLSLDIQFVYQRQIEEIIAPLSIVAAWMVYRSQDSHQKRRVLSHDRRENPNFNEATLSYLESEVWLAEDFPSQQLTQLTLPSSYHCLEKGTEERAKGIRNNSQILNVFAYVYPFNQEEKTDEYLLLWTDEPLSPPQQQSIEKQAQQLQDYRTLALEYSRQKQEIQLLEQVVRQGEHQLRTPLALIGLYAENLYLGLPEGPFQEQARIIRETAKELSANLTNLLYCCQQAKLQVAMHDLREIVAEIITLLQPKLKEKNLQISYPPTSVWLVVDGWQMKQVFENLLSNAVEFSPVGGTVTCDWRVYRTEILVNIRDQGPGFSQEMLKEAFTPFSSKRPGGTGLGLAIAKKIILDHQGSIWIDNLAIGGAQLSFTLPRQVSSPQSEVPSSNAYS